MLGALLYLRFTSLANQLRRQAGRLRNPRYFAGMLAVAAYFYVFLFRNAHRSWGPRGTGFDPMLVGATVTLVVVMILWIAGAWVLPDTNAGIRFSAAETAFLFPAPVSRRRLIHFSLASTQLKILFTAAVFALLRGHQESLAAFLLHLAGWWIMLAIADLHRIAAALTFARIRERTGSDTAARVLAVVLVLLYAGAVGWGLWRSGRLPTLEDLKGPGLASYCDELLRTGPVAWLLWPFRIAAAPFLAAGGRAFLVALGPALALVALHYLWVVGLQVSFEERAIAFAEKRAQRLASWAAGGSLFGPRTRKAGREPFRLAGPGRPEAAFLWKNLLSVGAAVPWSRIGLGLIVLAAVVVSRSAQVPRGSPGHPDAAPLVVLTLAGMVAFYTFLIGPQFARQDLRGDLGQMDLLKTYPLAGWQIVGAEMLAPAAILSGVLWLALLAATWAAGRLPHGGWLEPGARLAIAASLAALIPLICGLQLLVPNAALLYFPAWHQAGRARGGGVETMGQRLIFVLAQLLSLAVLLAPAAVFAALILAATAHWIGLAAAAVIAAAAAGAILASELGCGLWLLGGRFERYDLTHENLT